AEAAEILETALKRRPDPESDLSNRIRAELIGALFESLQSERAAEQLRGVNRRATEQGPGARMLRAQLATQIAFGKSSRLETIDLAAEAVGDDLLLEEETSDIFMWATGALMVAGEYRLAR